MNRVLALDFDGVLFDSRDECLITSTNAYRRLNNLSGWITATDQLDPLWIERFRRIRPYVRPAGEYWVTAHWLHCETSDLDAERFARLRDEQAGVIRDFQPLFFQVRAELREQDPDRWLALHTPVRHAIDALHELVGRVDLCLVSNKDRASLLALMRTTGVSIDDHDIYSGETGLSKPNAIRDIARQRGIPTEQVLFVDDQIDHLHNVAATGARCFWASWGYEPDPSRLGEFEALTELGEILKHIQTKT